MKKKLPVNHIDDWQKMLAETLPSKVLREIGIKYKVGKTDLAMMLVDLYFGVGLKEIQAIWKWDINNSGKGLDDSAIDKILGELKIRDDV
jgi:hypothetical protein